MASGLAVVASRVGGVPEVVKDGETGILVAPEDPPALAAAVVRVLADPRLRARLGAAALHAARAYDIGAYCAQLEQLYQRLASSGAASRQPRSP